MLFSATKFLIQPDLHVVYWRAKLPCCLSKIWWDRLLAPSAYVVGLRHLTVLYMPSDCAIWLGDLAGLSDWAIWLGNLTVPSDCAVWLCHLTESYQSAIWRWQLTMAAAGCNQDCHQRCNEVLIIAQLSAKRIIEIKWACIRGQLRLIVPVQKKIRLPWKCSKSP